MAGSEAGCGCQGSCPGSRHAGAGARLGSAQRRCVLVQMAWHLLHGDRVMTICTQATLDHARLCTCHVMYGACQRLDISNK